MNTLRMPIFNFFLLLNRSFCLTIFISTNDRNLFVNNLNNLFFYSFAVIFN
jgi:hypothetical protein